MKFFVNVTVDVDAEDVEAARWQVGNVLTKAQGDFDATGVWDWDIESVYDPGERY